MNTYSSYKDSGVEWIGKIPSEWSIKKLKYIGNLYGGLTGKSGKDFNNEDNPHNKPFIPFTNIFNNVYISDKHFQYVNVEPNERQNKVKKNDLFFLMSSEGYDDLGKSSILINEIDDLYLNSFCKGFRVNIPEINPLFINYQLSGDTHRKLISIEGKGFTRINLRQNKLNNTYMFIPPPQEQQQISDYLDNKTLKIDTLLEKTEQKIELLKEQRTSLINTTVTKGLNPNVEMKDSGVELVGETPSGWKRIILKHIFQYQKGFAFSSSLFVDTGVHVVKASDIKKTTINDSGVFISQDLVEKYEQVLLYENDIVMSTVGSQYHIKESSVGQLAIVPKELEGSLLNQNTVRLRLIKNKGMKNMYIFYVLQTRSYRGYLDIHSHGTANQASLNIVDILNFCCCTPPLQEQQQIVDYLDFEASKIDKLVDIESKRIDLLKEYRQSLISEVVTGKVDIRSEVLV